MKGKTQGTVNNKTSFKDKEKPAATRISNITAAKGIIFCSNCIKILKTSY